MGADDIDLAAPVGGDARSSVVLWQAPSVHQTHSRCLPLFCHLCSLRTCADGAAGGFRYFWLTDSCPQTVDEVQDRKPFEVLTLAGPIAEALQI